MKKMIRICLMAMAVSGVALSMQSFSTPAEQSAPSGDKYRTFVKTSARCRNSNCSCSGYWGYKHGNGTYEGSCQNTDGHGHTCGHSPQAHGLRAW